MVALLSILVMKDGVGHSFSNQRLSVIPFLDEVVAKNVARSRFLSNNYCFRRRWPEISK
jgi:hypothetical protein